MTYNKYLEEFPHFEKVLEEYLDWDQKNDVGDVIDYLDLNDEQQLAYDIVKEHRDTKSKKQLFMMIYGQGKGGSGKSKLINKIRQDYGESIVLCSPTASSAHDIGGNTFHRVCQLPILNNNK